MKVLDKIIQADSPTTSASTKYDKEKQSFISDSPALSDEGSDLQLREDAGDYPPPVTRWAIVIALLLGEFLVALDLTIVATAIPRITDEFKSIADVGWYGSAFFLTFAAYQSAWGKVYKYFPMKHAFFCSVIVFGIGTLICALAPKSVALVIGRAITGVGAAGVTNGVYTIISCIVPPRQVAMYLALVGVDFSIASVAGPLLGGVLTERLSWRWCFWIALPAGGASLGVVLFLFSRTGVDEAGCCGQEGEVVADGFPGDGWGGVEMPWSSGTVVGLLVGSVLLGVCFGVDQWIQGDRAQIVPRLMRKRTIAGLSTYILFCNATTFLLIYYLPIYFQATQGVSPSTSGIRSLPLILAMSLALLASSALVTWIGYFQPLLLAGGTLLTIGSGLMITLDIGSSPAKYIGYQILVGLGNGISSQIPLIVTLAFAAPEDIALTTALVLFFQLISGAISVSLAQSIFTNILIQKLPLYAPTVSPAAVIAVGASGLRDAFPPEELEGILKAYMVGLKASWIGGAVLAGLTLLAALVPEWKSIKGGKGKEKVAAVG